MKAVQVHNRTKELYIADYPDPVITEGEILVGVKAAGLNRSDLMQKRGLYPPPKGASPILGIEMAGTVLKVGDKVSGFVEGDRVCGLLSGGGYAEKTAIAANMAMKIPENLSFNEAAAIPEAFLTAYLKLIVLGKAAGGSSVLIHAGASGVGTAAIQLANKLGCKIFTTAGEESKLKFCRSLGADYLINYKKENFSEVIKQQTAGKGVDVILDFIGASYASSNLEAVAVDGRWILIGLLGGSRTEIDFGKLLSKRVALISSTLRNRSGGFKADLVKQFQQHIKNGFENGTYKPVIDSVYEWYQVNEAHSHMEQNKNTGKIILSLDQKSGQPERVD